MTCFGKREWGAIILAAEMLCRNVFSDAVGRQVSTGNAGTTL